MHDDVTAADTGSARDELARLLSRGTPSRKLLRQRVELFVAIGAGLGLLHLASRHSGGSHVALTAMLDALIPVFAPVCFVPAVSASAGRSRASAAVTTVRLAVVAACGVVVASVHLAVWAIVSASGGGGPTVTDIPFMVVTVAVTSVLAMSAYRAPSSERWAQPATVAAVIVLYVASFVVHGLVLTPSLTEVHAHVGAGSVAVEVASIVVSLGVVWLLMRREVRDGAHTAVRAAGAGDRYQPSR